MQLANESDSKALWNLFLAAPALATGNHIFQIGSGDRTVNGGRVLLSGSSISTAKAQPTPSRNIFPPNFGFTHSRVCYLKVVESNNNQNPHIYWYPYLSIASYGGTFEGAGEVTIPSNAETGTVAVTATMNGCSLRIYQNIITHDVKFFHDNNGTCVRHVDLEIDGWVHLISVNSENTAQKKRGREDKNLVYWHASYSNAASACLICSKSENRSWKIYKMVADMGIGESKVIADSWLPYKTHTEWFYTWKNTLATNGLIANVQQQW